VKSIELVELDLEPVLAPLNPIHRRIEAGKTKFLVAFLQFFAFYIGKGVWWEK
jgi:hypothetical protein